MTRVDLLEQGDPRFREQVRRVVGWGSNERAAGKSEKIKYSSCTGNG